MRLETYKMAASIFLKFLTLKCDISRTIWRIEVSDGSLFCIFHALSFELNLFFDRTCPLSVKLILKIISAARDLWKALKGLIQKAYHKNMNWSFIKHVFFNEIVLWGFFSVLDK